MRLPDESSNLLPEGSPVPDLIREIACDDPKRRDDAYERVWRLDRFQTWEEARTPSWSITEAEATAILHAAQTIEFPLPQHEWRDGLDGFLVHLWRSPHPSLTALVKTAYRKQPDTRRRCALLTLLCIIGTREAAMVFMACVREDGWPDGVHERLIEELAKLLAHSDVMLPDVLSSAGSLLKYVAESALNALAGGMLDASKVANRLEALSPHVLTRLKRALKLAKSRQDRPGIAWRFSERYFTVRHEAGVLLDLAGYLKEPRLQELMRSAALYKDPRIVMFAVLGLLRRGESVSVRMLNQAARSTETRADLFHGLERLGLEDRFPKKWRTWELFAAAKMVEWLIYPTELGREPDDLRLEHIEWFDKRSKLAMFVWKFRIKGKQWIAGVSGPHHLRGSPKPVDGDLTFSRFDEWENATPMEHLEKCAGTVVDWRNSDVC